MRSSLHKRLGPGVLPPWFFFSCNREAELPVEEVSGLLLEAVSGQPIAGYPVRLTRYRQTISTQTDAEFPAGKPVMVYEFLQMRTDAAKRFRF